MFMHEGASGTTKILHFTQTIDELTCVYNKDFIKLDLLLVLTVFCGILTFNRLILEVSEL